MSPASASSRKTARSPAAFSLRKLVPDPCPEGLALLFAGRAAFLAESAANPASRQPGSASGLGWEAQMTEPHLHIRGAASSGALPAGSLGRALDRGSQAVGGIRNPTGTPGWGRKDRTTPGAASGPTPFAHGRQRGARLAQRPMASGGKAATRKAATKGITPAADGTLAGRRARACGRAFHRGVRRVGSEAAPAREVARWPSGGSLRAERSREASLPSCRPVGRFPELR